MSHPSKDIVGSDGKDLEGRRVVLCVTGSVSAYKAPDIARELMRHGAEVYPVLTGSAAKIIHPDLMQWATGNRVVQELTGAIEHVQFTTGPDKADLILVAPATANTIGKIASGVDDTPVTSYVSSALGAGIPILIAPAMHDTMLSHPIIQENVRRLKKEGVGFIEPKMEEGKAKLAGPAEVLAAVVSILSKKDLDEMRVIITGGPTAEPIDSTRVLTNRSSGKMAGALGRAAAARGAKVTMVLGPTSIDPPANVEVHRVETAKEMLETVRKELAAEKFDLMIAAAAVADFAPSKIVKGKISSSENREITLRLQRTSKIIDDVKKLSPNTFLVIFKAEHGLSAPALIKKAGERMKEADADMAVVNDISRKDIGFNSDENEVYVVDREGRTEHIRKESKTGIANRILNLALDRMKGK